MQPYVKTVTLTDVHTDRFGRLKSAMLLQLAQEAAGEHCALLGADFHVISQKNLMWAIIRQKAEIIRLPENGETITIKTWPMPTTRTAYPRSTAAYDSQGKLLFRLISLWVLMDTNSRGIVLPGNSGVEVEGVDLPDQLTTPSGIAAKPWKNTALRHVRYSQLDRNGHMNNCKYLDWLEDLLNSDFHKDHSITGFTVCYLSEAREKEEILLQWELDEAGIFHLEGKRPEGKMCEGKERVFALQARFY